MSDRQQVLIDMNVYLLQQALRMLEDIDDGIYVESPPGFTPHRAGGHVRHILEFYECFLDGMDCSHVDYDARKRDETVERSRTSAMAKIRVIVQRLENDPLPHGDSIIWVRMEDSRGNRVNDAF